MVKPEFKFDGSKLIVSISVDTNNDGQPIIKNTTEIDLAEIPDEVMAAILAKKAKA